MKKVLTAINDAVTGTVTVLAVGTIYVVSFIPLALIGASRARAATAEAAEQFTTAELEARGLDYRGCRPGHCW